MASEFVEDQNKAGRGTVTARRLVTLLGTVFAGAVKDELISANPARDVDSPKLDREPVAPWEPDQVRTFLDRSAQHRIGPLFEVAILTGLRRGELCGLRWSDVDLVTREITVLRNRVTANGRVLEQKTTKTKAGLRTVALSDFAVATLLAWQLRQAEEAENAAEAWQSDGHVFTMEDGRALDPTYITRLFQKLRKGPGEELPQLTFHGLRNCHASLIGTVASDAVNGAASLIARTVRTHQGVEA